MIKRKKISKKLLETRIITYIHNPSHLRLRQEKYYLKPNRPNQTTKPEKNFSEPSPYSCLVFHKNE